MRPRRAIQCIGTRPEGNARMEAAWKLKPAHGQLVYIVREDKFKVEEWKFGWFTQAGARLWMKVEGRHYSRLINWDKGDNLYIDEKEAGTRVYFNCIIAKTKHELEIKKLKEIMNKIIPHLMELSEENKDDV